MSETVLRLENVCKRFPQFALENVSFSLDRGYIMGFIGENGAGKTTTIRSILGALKINSGSISVFGSDPVGQGIAVRERIGAVYDTLMLPSHLRLREIEAMLRRFYPRWDSGQYRALSERFQLPEKTPCGKYSKGMQMKLMLTAALSHHAELLILDEPTSGLDPVTRDLLLDILTEYIADGEGSVLFSTHITDDVERIADYITVLHGGKVWYTGEKDDLMERYAVVQRGTGLPEALRPHCIGLHKTASGYAALLPTDELALLPADAVYEPATTADMLIYLAKEGGQSCIPS